MTKRHTNIIQRLSALLLAAALIITLIPTLINASANSEDAIEGDEELIYIPVSEEESEPEAALFGLELFGETQSGYFLQQVDKIDSTSDLYAIVSPNGSFALTNSSSASPAWSTKVSLRPVKGNPKYFEYPENLDGTMLFQFGTAVGTSGQSTIASIEGASNRYITLSGTNTIFGSATNINVSYDSKAGWFKLYRTYYLNNRSTGFTATNSYSGGAYFSAYCNLSIYKVVHTDLIIPEDPQKPNDVITPGDEPDTKPSYPSYLQTSHSKLGTELMQGDFVEYASDKSSSQIENKLTGEASSDGRVWTDKSVIYESDDYNAFSSYENGSFGVTLSALTQQYQTENLNVSIPIDVVFVLDLSESMTTTVNGSTRAQSMVDALNSSMNHIFMMNPENRVGVVYYNSGSGDILELGRYYSASSASSLPDYDNNNYRYLQLSGSTLSTDSNLRNAGGSRDKVASRSSTFVGATYTQLGLQRASNMYLRVTDTDYTLPNGTVVGKTPLVILLSDGNPTLMSSNYMSPSDGPHYGSGNGNGKPNPSPDGSSEPNGKGIMGFYTVLSANYFKSQIGIHYNRPAVFGTVGIGIYKDTESLYGDAANNSVGDDYTRAVLSPSRANLNIIKANTSPFGNGIFGSQFQKLLDNEFTDTTVRVQSTLDTYRPDPAGSSPVGVTNVFVPVISNPYEDFNYADFTYVKRDANNTDLIGAFNTIIDRSVEQRLIFSQSLSVGTNLHFVDTLGEHMKVKSGFTLRYQGTNYETALKNESEIDGSVYKEYSVSGDVYVENASEESIALENTVITLKIDPDGTETVLWSIQDDLLPAYRRAIFHDYYFEMLPIRLIYQVGLDESHEMENDTPYYTNSWGENGSATYAVFTPHEENPFYSSEKDISESYSKASNTSASSSTEFTASRSGDDVYTYLGNNGRLLKGTRTVDLQVEKRWFDKQGQSIDDENRKSPVSVQLYQKIGDGEPSPYLDPVELNSDGFWEHSWSDLPAAEDGELCYYSIVETTTGNFITDYEGNNTNSSSTIVVNNRLQTTSISVEKKWLDPYGTELTPKGKPAVKVHLMRKTDEPGSVYETADINGVPIELRNSNSWKYTFMDLPIEDEEGNSYLYAVTEEEVVGFITSYSVDGGGETQVFSGEVGENGGEITIFNKLDNSIGSITVQKKWLDESGSEITDTTDLPDVQIDLYLRMYESDDYYFKPESFADYEIAPITVKLRSLTLSEHNNWSFKIDNLAKYSLSGDKVLHFYYYAVETPVEGYNVYYSSNNIITPTDDSAGIQSGTIVASNRKQGVGVELLPGTGASGVITILITGAGLTLLALAQLGFILRKRRRIRKGAIRR
ncbi:Cna B-type domain-containing protein [Clostridiaceae bacterium OttesenSCG-928-D20]|nr:Cna B-type domain-containing protein [Clostridiaceae bacterium OttesenSCG-928-D20]